MNWLAAILFFLPLLLLQTAPEERPNAHKAASPDIRSVDFRNFDYPIVRKMWLDTPLHLRQGVQKNLFRVKGVPKDSPENGEARLEQVIYGSLNGGGEVAVVEVIIFSGGSGKASELFVYEMAADKPHLLWSFQSGDRADEGLRDVYFKKGNLVVEIYQERPDDPLCCASTFNRIFYSAKAGKLRVFAREKDLPVPYSEFHQ